MEAVTDHWQICFNTEFAAAQMTRLKEKNRRQVFVLTSHNYLGLQVVKVQSVQTHVQAMGAACLPCCLLPTIDPDRRVFTTQVALPHMDRSATRYRGRQRQLKQTVQQQLESLETQMQQMRVQQVRNWCSVRVTDASHEAVHHVYITAQICSHAKGCWCMFPPRGRVNVTPPCPPHSFAGHSASTATSLQSKCWCSGTLTPDQARRHLKITQRHPNGIKGFCVCRDGVERGGVCPGSHGGAEQAADGGGQPAGAAAARRNGGCCAHHRPRLLQWLQGRLEGGHSATGIPLLPLSLAHALKWLR